MRKVLFELLTIAASVIVISCTSKECADFAAKASSWGVSYETCDSAHVETALVFEGRQSQDDDYENMVSKVDISEIKNLDAVASATYMRQINEFLLNNGDLFFAGKFVDTKGYVISSDSKDIRSSAFVNGGKMGVVVWNASSGAPAIYSVSAEGYQMTSTLSPETDTCVAGELAPQSLQLVIFEK